MLSTYNYFPSEITDQGHNVLASRKVDWRTSLEKSTGNTPDISMFRFHFWEKIWFFDPTKASQDNWIMERFLGFDHFTGDIITYWIETEVESKPHILARSSIRTRIVIGGLDQSSQ